MKFALPARFAPLVEQVRRNPRLQAGMALIALLLVAWLFLSLGDLRREQVRQLDDARARFFKMRRLAGQDIWIERAAAADRLARALEAEVPSAGSPGLAQASLQGWLNEVVAASGVALRVDVQAPTTVPGTDLVEATATVSGGIEPSLARDLVHRIESSTSLVTVPMLMVRSDGANKTMAMTVKAFYRLPAAAGTDVGDAE